MSEVVVKTATTMNVDEKHRKFINMTILSMCNTIIEMGGFDNFINSLNLSVISEYDKTLFPYLRKYISERKL